MPDYWRRFGASSRLLGLIFAAKLPNRSFQPAVFSADFSLVVQKPSKM
jgi:hypothetical protein